MIEAGLIFMDELNRVASSLQILRGTLSRWLLPYDNNTSISDQISNVNSVVDAMPDSIRGKLTEKQVHYLVSGLNSVRQLVRVKIADDNDLEQVWVRYLLFMYIYIYITLRNSYDFVVNISHRLVQRCVLLQISYVVCNKKRKKQKVQ